MKEVGLSLKASLVSIIDDIESRLPSEELARCMLWCDKNHKDAWTKAIDALDRQLGDMQTSKDFSGLKECADAYRVKLTALIKSYCKAHDLDPSKMIVQRAKEEALWTEAKTSLLDL